MPIEDCINPDFFCGSVSVGCIGRRGGGLDRRNEDGKFVHEDGKFVQILGFFLLLIFVFLLLFLHGSCYMLFDLIFPGILLVMQVAIAAPFTFLVMNYFLAFDFLERGISKR